MERHDKGQDLVMVASEPLTFERGGYSSRKSISEDSLPNHCPEGDWVTVPTNSILSIHKQTVLIHPIIDQYYQPPSYSRSAAFAESKGMVGRGPDATVPSPKPSLPSLDHTASDSSDNASDIEPDHLGSPEPPLVLKMPSLQVSSY